MKKKKISFVFNSPVVLGFALISLIVLIVDGIPGISIMRKYFSVYRAPLTDIFTYFRFFSHILGHASYEHYMSNMLLILVIGPGLEEKYGSRRLMAAILITAFVTGLINFIFFPNTALLGASGIVFMMIVMASFAGSSGGTIPVTLVLVFVLYIGQEIWNAITVSDSVSQLAHITGGVCGAVLGFSYTGRRGRK